MFIIYVHALHTYLFHTRFPETLCISFNNAANSDDLPLPLLPTITVNFPIITEHKNNN